MADCTAEKTKRKMKKEKTQLDQGLIHNLKRLLRALGRKDLALWRKGVILAALAYFLWPADAFPDLGPGGYLDDAAVIAAAIRRIVSTHFRV